jgi:hypothetical protein
MRRYLRILQEMSEQAVERTVDREGLASDA